MSIILNESAKNAINGYYSKSVNLDYKDIQIEIETRFIVNGNVNIPYTNFQRVVDYYIVPNNVTYNIDTVEIQDIIDNNNAIWRHIISKKNNTGEIKIKLGEYVDKEKYGVKVSVSAEISNEPKPKNLSKKILTRNRKRWSVILEDGIKLDLTEINNRDRQIEIEINDIAKVNRLAIWTEELWRILHDSEIIYTLKEKKDLSDYTENILGQPLSYNLLTNARQLHFHDVIYGGIVGCINKTYSTDPDGYIHYSVAYKTDGVRHLLIINNNGDIWLTNPPRIFNLIKRGGENDDTYKFLAGTILDVEWVPMDSRLNGAPSVKYWIHVIDALSVATTSYGKIEDIRNNDRGVRMKTAMSNIKQIETLKVTEINNQINNIVIDDNIQFYIKDNYYFKTPDEFFQTMRDVYNGIASLTFKTDGFIFTPGETRYKLSDIESMPIKIRKLTNYPDICKLKPREMITMDLLHKNNKLYVNNRGNLREFHGYNVPKNLMENVVAEFNLDNRDFILNRYRSDKPLPNRLDVVLDNIKSIQENITIEDLAGMNMKLVFKYHNKIKESLILSLVDKDDVVLDIGGGNGGDLGKYAKAEVGAIYYVEPNKTNAKELVSRLKTYKMQDKVQVIVTGGENTEVITKQIEKMEEGSKVDVVALMLSLSFFWKSEEMLDSLVNTIVNNLKPDGKIIFLTIDGDAISELAHSSIRAEEAPKSRVVFGVNDYVELPDLNKCERQVHFKLSNTILESETEEGIQKEWLVILDNLTAKLEKYGFGLTEIHIADGEKLLPPDGCRLSRLYSYGYYSQITDSRITNNGIKYKLRQKPKVAKAITKLSVTNDVIQNSVLIEKWSPQYVIFGGSEGTYSPLHPFYPVEFTTKEQFNIDDGEVTEYTWENAQQYYYAAKVDYFISGESKHDIINEGIFNSILNETDPSKYYDISTKIADYSEEDWIPVMVEVMKEALQFKFKNVKLHKFLLDTENRELIFADSCTRWGGGADIGNINVNKIKGHNLMGKLLMEIRK